jgi:MoxR-like ATPase
MLRKGFEKFMNIKDIEDLLRKVNYIPSKDIVYALSGSINEKFPLLIEGAPGVGKTSLAKATSAMLNIPLYRVQFYEGLTADKILYDYNYQKQLLTIESIKATLESQLKDKNIDEAMSIASSINFYDENFIIERPILKSIKNNAPCVLLLDEVDKASEEIEYTLLEFLDEFSLTIPQYGTIKCENEENKPIVFLTSNNYRDLSDALKRRCNFLYIEKKTMDEIYEILKIKVQISDKFAMGVAKCMVEIQDLNLKQIPSISESITWATYLKNNMENGFDDVEKTLFLLAKNKDDQDIIKASGIIQENFKDFKDFK